jgi:tryptophan halogenase
MPETRITVVESEEIGILGAGEGSTPHLVNFLDFVGIPTSEVVKHADATIKNGIKFTNWQNKQDYFYHGFSVFNGLDFDGSNVNENAMSINSSFVSNSIFSKNINESSFVSKVSEKNKVMFKEKNQKDPNALNNILNFESLGYFSIHFNASKLANLLKKIALGRGVVRIEGTVDSINEDEFGNISSVGIGDRLIDLDFIFDCSGFARQVIGKHYSSEWKSHSDKLPVDSAVPFFIPIQENESVPAYTEAIAMKYGWMWKIPNKERYGCGYVYDSSLITEKEAIEEIEEYLGHEPFYPRKDKGGFKFSAGYYKEPWKNNCIAVGISSGFIEPLEATSIWVTIQSLKAVFSNTETLSFLDKRHSDHFNDKFRSMSDEVVDFIYFHYMSNRTDTDFWKKFSNEKAPKKVQKMIKDWEYRLPEFDDFNKDSTWGMNSWLVVAAGINRLNTGLMKKSFDLSFAHKEAAKSYQYFKDQQDLAASSCVDHNLFLKELRR